MMISTLCGMCVCVLRNIEHIHVCIMSTLSGMCVLQHAICTFFQKMCRRTRCGGKKDLKTRSWKEGLEDYTTHLFSIKYTYMIILRKVNIVKDIALE